MREACQAGIWDSDVRPLSNHVREYRRNYSSYHAKQPWQHTIGTLGHSVKVRLRSTPAAVIL